MHNVLCSDHNVLSSFDVSSVSMFHGFDWLRFWLLALVIPCFAILNVLYNVVMVDLFGGLMGLQSQGSLTLIIQCWLVSIDVHIVRLGLGAIMTMVFDLSPWMS